MNSFYLGIFDSHEYLQSLCFEAESDGVNIIRNCHIHGGTLLTSTSTGISTGTSISMSSPIKESSPSIRLHTSQGDIDCRLFINCTGVHSPRVTSSIGGFPSHLIPKYFMCKGNYFKLSGMLPLNLDIYIYILRIESNLDRIDCLILNFTNYYLLQ